MYAVNNRNFSSHSEKDVFCQRRLGNPCQLSACFDCNSSISFPTSGSDLALSCRGTLKDRNVKVKSVA